MTNEEIEKFRRSLRRSNPHFGFLAADKWLGVHGYASASEYLMLRLLSEGKLGKSDKCRFCGGPVYWLRDLCEEIEGLGEKIVPPNTGWQRPIKSELAELRRKRTALRKEIAELQAHVASLTNYSSLHQVAAYCGEGRREQTKTKRLLTEAEIVDVAAPLSSMAGVYFGVKDGRVVYVGQSVNIFSRVATSGHHGVRGVDGIAFITCPADHLNLLESLYIHLLQPERNGRDLRTGRMTAPLPWEEVSAEMRKLGIDLPYGDVK